MTDTVRGALAELVACQDSKMTEHPLRWVKAWRAARAVLAPTASNEPTCEEIAPGCIGFTNGCHCPACMGSPAPSPAPADGAHDDPQSDLVRRLRAASHDERLSTGMLYREAADAIERITLERDTQRDITDREVSRAERAEQDAGRLLEQVEALEKDRDTLLGAWREVSDAYEAAPNLPLELLPTADLERWTDFLTGLGKNCGFVDLYWPREPARVEPT